MTSLIYISIYMGVLLLRLLMRRSPKIRFWHYHLFIVLPALLMGIVITFLIFPLRHVIRNWRFWPLFIFMNESEKSVMDSDFGDEGWRKRKGYNLEKAGYFKRWLIFYEWNAFRNPHWNLKNLFAPKQGEKTNLNIIKYDPITFVNKRSVYTWNNGKFQGVTSITYYIGKTKYFRYSKSNGKSKFMIGHDDKRPLFKWSKI